MKKRNIYIVMFLSIITFGLYTIYYMCAIQKDLNAKTKNYKIIPIMIILQILSLGTYYVWWCYCVEETFKKELGNENIYFSLTTASLLAPIGNSIIQSIINKNEIEEQEIEKTKRNKIKTIKYNDDSFFDYNENELEQKTKIQQENTINNKNNKTNYVEENEEESMEIDIEKAYDYYL